MLDKDAAQKHGYGDEVGRRSILDQGAGVNETSEQIEKRLKRSHEREDQMFLDSREIADQRDKLKDAITAIDIPWLLEILGSITIGRGFRVRPPGPDITRVVKALEELRGVAK